MQKEQTWRSNAAGSTPAARSPNSTVLPDRPRTVPGPSKPIKTSSLHKSPFAILGVTIRDDRRKIVEQAEHKSLELNPDDCQNARSDLTNPRNRLAVEMAWLPGVSPRRASQLLEGLLKDPMAVRKESGLPTLSHCNLMASAFEGVSTNHPPEDLADFIQELAHLVSELDIDDVIRDINEDRSVSGFPEVKSVDQVESEIGERKRYYRSVIKDALNRLPPEALLKAITAAVDGATSGGHNHAPELIDELVDGYAVEVQGVLDKEAENLKKLIEATRSVVGSGEAAVTPLIEKLERVARNWDKFAQPIQLSSKARGIDHDQSISLAYLIRSLVFDLFTKHNMLKSSQRLTALVQEIFAELPQFAERAEEDASTLSDIHAKRVRDESQAKGREAEWARQITFNAEVGLVFKDSLSISPSGIEWKGQRFALDSITAVRWGAVKNSVNGISTGTDYSIGLAARSGSTNISLKKESTYSGFVEALWRAVCVRLMSDMSEALEAGKSITVGDMVIEDRFVSLTKHKFLSFSEKIRVPWSDVDVWSANGEFVVSAKNDKKTYGSASYMNHWNTHLLDHIVRSGFKKGITKLSDYFKS